MFVVMRDARRFPIFIRLLVSRPVSGWYRLSVGVERFKFAPAAFDAPLDLSPPIITIPFHQRSRTFGSHGLIPWHLDVWSEGVKVQRYLTMPARP